KRATSSCCKATCHKQEPAKEKNDCGPNRCNPFMGCSAGNFYVHNYFSITFTTIILPKTKIALFDDNRVSKQLSECWHPPEITSCFYPTLLMIQPLFFFIYALTDPMRHFSMEHPVASPLHSSQ